MNRRLAKAEERKKALVSQSTALLDAAEKDDRDLIEDEQTNFDANQAELKTVQAAIDREHELKAYINDVPLHGELEDFEAANKTNITNPVAAWEEDPKKGFADPTEFLTSVITAGHKGILDDRLKFMATAGSDEAGQYADPYGGFLVPEGLAPGILRVEPEADPIGGGVTSVPMTSPTVKFNARVDKSHATSVSGGLVVTRRQETQTVASSRTQYEQITLTAASLFGISYATNEILERSPISFAAVINAGFSDQFKSHLINERLNGTGVGEFEGIMKNPALITIGAEAGQDADTIVYENLVKMRSRCWGYGKAVWIANHDCLPQLMSIVFPGTLGGFPIWQVSAREDHPDTLFGRPLVLTEYAKTIGDLGDLVLADWSQFMEGTFKPLRSAESMHVRFLEHEMCFKFWIENDGRGWWRTALTPKNGSTLSPFVTLAAR